MSDSFNAQIDQLQQEITAVMAQEPTQLKKKFLGKGGKIPVLIAQLGTLSPEVRKTAGQQLNALKKRCEAALVQQQKTTTAPAPATEDLTLPPPIQTKGSTHLLYQLMEEISTILEKVGFSRTEGPEIEDRWHNFTALNFPNDHPAMAMQDTFFIDKMEDSLLRTHTSSVQIRVLKEQEPPIRAISCGRVFRNETISARSHCMFHQVEALCIDKNISFVDLKAFLHYFTRTLFGNKTKIRLRPSYFPFTEPSAEVDIECLLYQGEGCSVCKKSGWVEIGGAGMVDPAVLTHCNIDPEIYTGYAFGMGIERIAMLLHQIDDIRLFTQNDLRFLNQF